MANDKHTATTRIAVLIGSAFILATSSVGPAFLTQTATFTQQYGASFGFAILMAILISWIAQLNFSRIIGVTGLRGQEIANRIRPGLGSLLGVVIAVGGFVFNIGNIAGVALGLNAILGLNVRITAAIAGILGIIMFSSKSIGKVLDYSATVMGVIILALLGLITVFAAPPVGEAIAKTIHPDTIPAFAILTLIGGTVGGFIPFSGAHRLIDARVVGEENLSEINKSVNLGMAASAAVRVLMFLATLAVISLGHQLNPENPASSPFQIVFGDVGMILFGIVFACAALTSVNGNSYTSISFLRQFQVVNRHENIFIIAYIVLSTIMCIFVGQPAVLLVLVGTVNAFILPFSLIIMLIASRKKEIVGDYQHSRVLTVLGIVVIVLTLIFAVMTLVNNWFN